VRFSVIAEDDNKPRHLCKCESFLIDAKKSGAGRRFFLSYLFCSARQQSTRTVVALHPVALAHVFDPDFGARARRMQEAVVAQIDADMRKSAAHGIEENEVAGLQFVAVDHRTDLALLSGTTRQQHADRFLEDDLDKGAAVETGIRVGAAETVVDTDQFESP
jgi:hypothetical protein